MSSGAGSPSIHKSENRRPRTDKRRVREIICALILASPVAGLQSTARAQTPADRPAPAPPWAAVVGQSGLRRLYSTGGDLGDLLNRQSSYRVANRVGEASSSVNGYVVQWDSLIPVDIRTEKPFFIRTLARIARRFEEQRLNGANDRFDIGALYAPTRRSYVGVGLAYEHTKADFEFIDGESTGSGIGPRVDAGIVLERNLALGIRIEEMHFGGDSSVFVATPRGPLKIDRDIEYRRTFLQAELIARYGRPQVRFLPPRMQLGWMSGVQYLNTRYEHEVDSRGQTVVEPFGDKERLGNARAGVFLGSNLGRRNAWNINIELMVDREFNTNMNNPIDDRTAAYVRGGLAYVLRPGKRLQFDYQGFRSLHGLRKRNNFSIIWIVDF
jgi:hypothetical protein